jgi:hypothetical protein
VLQGVEGGQSDGHAKLRAQPVSPIGSSCDTLGLAAGRSPTRVNQASSLEQPSGIGWPMPLIASM